MSAGSALRISLCGVLVLMLSCGSEGPPKTLLGEIHVHQFPGGAHVFADFAVPAIPLAGAPSDALRQLPYLPTQSDGECQVFVLPRCTQACPSPGACVATDTCGAPPPATPVTAGAMRIGGGKLIPDLLLSYAASIGLYESVPPALAGPLFVGGETLTVSADGSAVPAFSASVVAPHPLLITAPPLAPLHYPRSGALTVTWTPEATPRDETIYLTVAASTPTGSASAWIDCTAPDAAGSVSVAANLLARLPPPPRNLDLVAERSASVIVAAGVDGIRFHVAQEVQASGTD